MLLEQLSKELLLLEILLKEQLLKCQQLRSLGLRNQSGDALFEEHFVSLTETNMNLANQACSIDQISRRHAGNGESAP